MFGIDFFFFIQEVFKKDVKKDIKKDSKIKNFQVKVYYFFIQEIIFFLFGVYSM